MTELLAVDGAGWNRFDKLMLWLLPPFLAYIGAKVGGGDIIRIVVAGVGVIAGTAVVRGIEVAQNAGRTKSRIG